MHNSRNRLGIMSLGALMAAALAMPGRLDRQLRWWGASRSKASPRRDRTWWKPHQGAREMARRRGGQDWQDFKAGDRVRRGLPVSWPFQLMEG